MLQANESFLLSFPEESTIIIITINNYRNGNKMLLINKGSIYIQLIQKKYLMKSTMSSTQRLKSNGYSLKNSKVKSRDSIFLI